MKHTSIPISDIPILHPSYRFVIIFFYHNYLFRWLPSQYPLGLLVHPHLHLGLFSNMMDKIILKAAMDFDDKNNPPKNGK